MKQLLFIALAIAAPAASQSVGNPPTTDQRNALQAYFACLYQRAHDADDGAVDPTALAREIAPGCRHMLGAAATIFAEGKSQTERDDLYQKWLALEDRQVTKVILTQRQDRLTSGLSPTATAVPSPKATAAKPKPAVAKLATTKPARPAKAKTKAPPAKGPDGKPISEWRRAYIASHGHEPPLTAK